MELKKQIQEECKQTIGYSEAENKESFMVGVGVAILKTQEHYHKHILNLEKERDFYMNSADTYKKDLTILSSIINRYSDND
jgi:hypothetical protein